jgi:hypothetical protein
MHGRAGEKPASQGAQVPPTGPAFPAVQLEYCATNWTSVSCRATRVLTRGHWPNVKTGLPRTIPGVTQGRNSRLRERGTRQRRVVLTTRCARGVAPKRFTFQKDARKARKVVEDGCGQHSELIASQAQLPQARAAVEGGRRQRA